MNPLMIWITYEKGSMDVSRKVADISRCCCNSTCYEADETHA